MSINDGCVYILTTEQVKSQHKYKERRSLIVVACMIFMQIFSGIDVSGTSTIITYRRLAVWLLVLTNNLQYFTLSFLCVSFSIRGSWWFCYKCMSRRDKYMKYSDEETTKALQHATHLRQSKMSCLQ